MTENLNNILKQLQIVEKRLQYKHLTYDDYRELHNDKEYLKNLLRNTPVHGKIIWIGDIKEDDFAHLNPIDAFEKAYQLTKIKEFNIETNNAQVIELIEVICGEDNIAIYLNLKGKYCQIPVRIAYQYLGKLFEIITHIRIEKEFGLDTSDKEMDKEIHEKLEEYYMEYEGWI